MTISRRDFARAVAGALVGTGTVEPGAPRQGARPRPSPSQLAWQQDELAVFLHFGVNTFTDREWGDGREDPGVFDPTLLDARQWARAAKAGGARALILTAKHHDGFCLWPSRLTELLTRYGPISEVWFDGANGEGPNGRRQVYDWPRVFGLVRRLQPRAVMFSDAGPDVRWCGNEAGVAGDPNWSTVDPVAVPYPGASGDAVIAALQHGDPQGSVWRPAETDTSIRPGWFYHPAEDERVKPVEQLVGIWLTSVGRNSKLLLNVPPTRDGVLHATDVARLAALRAHLASLFAEDLAADRPVSWRLTGGRTAVAEVDLGKTVTIGLARLEEDIARSQCVARYAVQGSVDGTGEWRDLARGTTVGYRKVDRFEPMALRRVRVVVEDAVATPRPLRIGLYRGD